MMRRSNDRVHPETGAIGTLIVMWLVVVVVIGIAAMDTGSILFTRFRLADVASSAATQAANAYRSSHNETAACKAAVDSIAADDPAAQLAKKEGCRVDAATGQVTITVRKLATTIAAGRIPFTKRFAKVTATETNGPSTL